MDPESADLNAQLFATVQDPLEKAAVYELLQWALLEVLLHGDVPRSVFLRTLAHASTVAVAAVGTAAGSEPARSE